MRIVLLLLFPLFSISQSLPSIEEKTKGWEKVVGFLPYFIDEANGKLWLEINQTNQELLYCISLPSGLGSNDIGLDRGLLGSQQVIRFVRNGKKLFLHQPNYDYRANSTDALEKKAVEESFASSIIWSFTIEAATGNSLLVDATDFLLRDAMKAAARIKSAKQGNFVLDKTRCGIYFTATKNFPKNTELDATITLVNNDGEVGPMVRAVAANSDAITLRMHHSFVELPDAGYKPRAFDPRAGYFPISYYDYSSPVSEPIEKYFIRRHRLEKKNPGAAISEPIKPIIYYLDNGTPEPIRSALLDGARWWNQAFTAAGFKEAFRVELLPAGADPMDIRYNMINWVHRSTRGWSYGASVTDPRTGEIIKGNVTLGSLRVRQDYLIAQGLLAPFENGVPADDKMLAMALARLRQLAAHEVGHTLGIMHNYASSVNNRASVMDYPHPVVKFNSSGELDLSEAYDTKIGEWDKLAINYGYAQFPKGTNESAALDKLLREGAAKGLQFIADRDARSPGGSHPQAHLWDNGSNPVEELNHVMKVRAKALANFGTNSIRTGTPLAMLEDVLVPVYLYHRYQVEAAVKMLGGISYSYAVKGDGSPSMKLVPKADQLKALDAIIKTIDPQALVIPDKIVQLIPPRPAGYSSSRELFSKRSGLNFDPLSPAETAADLPFSFLFHPDRINRMEIQGHQGGLSAGEMAEVLITATFKAKRKSGLEAMIQQQTEQVLLTYLLSWSVNEALSMPARARGLAILKELKDWLETELKTTTDPSSKAHLAYALERMKAPDKAKPTQQAGLPPGAPIGER
ncbi:zinc-dependent metalloprotease [Flavihumibacter sp. UBA7668]|uniref:zinc-dependent metalloprotease n=1 Tax=Flavihumibacter sp. UBA7668 TaxID=1946542 RepID=UPI0025C608B5|nr:zinc-dependent metalloprotease [Flavihumibacter sp. UBA7668]